MLISWSLEWEATWAPLKLENSLQEKDSNNNDGANNGFLCLKDRTTSKVI